MYLSNEYNIILTTDDWDNDMFERPMEIATSVGLRFCLIVWQCCVRIAAASTRTRCYIFTLKKIQRSNTTATAAAKRLDVWGFLERKNPSFTMCYDSFYTVSQYRETAGFNTRPTSSAAQAGQMLR